MSTCIGDNIRKKLKLLRRAKKRSEARALVAEIEQLVRDGENAYERRDQQSRIWNLEDERDDLKKEIQSLEEQLAAYQRADVGFITLDVLLLRTCQSPDPDGLHVRGGKETSRCQV